MLRNKEEKLEGVPFGTPFLMSVIIFTMVKAITKYIKDKPYFAQIAKDGVWESAFKINLTNPDFKDAKLQLYLMRKPFQNLDAELFFKDSDEEVYVLGLTFNKKLLTQSSMEFITNIITLAKEFINFEDLINDLDATLIGKQYLFKGEPDLIRIGIVNHWFSVGPILLWQKGWKKEINNIILQERLSVKPEVVRTNLNYQGMSFIFNMNNSSPGVRHWIKSPCSKKMNGEWMLDEKKIIHYLKDWSNFEEI